MCSFIYLYVYYVYYVYMFVCLCYIVVKLIFIYEATLIFFKGKQTVVTRQPFIFPPNMLILMLMLMFVCMQICMYIYIYIYIYPSSNRFKLSSTIATLIFFKGKPTVVTRLPFVFPPNSALSYGLDSTIPHSVIPYLLV